MESKKQSSVEWLFFKIHTSFVCYDSGRISHTEFLEEIWNHKEQAKAMHQEEMIDFVRYLEGVRTSELQLIDEYNDFYIEQ